MRFDFVRLHLPLLIIVAVYVLMLGSQQDLDLYIHPRYIVFTIVMSVVGLVIVLANSYFAEESNKHDNHDSSKLMYLPLFIVVIAAMLFPARTLTSATVSQRTTDAGSLVATAESRATSTLFASSSKGLGLNDWSRLLIANTEPSYYVNKPAKISGFIYDADLGSDTVWLARFILTCCAVDAQPVGVPVRIADWQSNFSEDQWIEVEGEFTLLDTAQGQELVLQPTLVQPIDQPSNPYAN